MSKEKAMRAPKFGLKALLDKMAPATLATVAVLAYSSESRAQTCMSVCSDFSPTRTCGDWNNGCDDVVSCGACGTGYCSDTGSCISSNTVVAIPATKDTYTRCGVYWGDTFGQSADLVVKESDSGDGYDRRAWLTFSVVGLHDVASATLKLFVNSVAAAPSVHPIISAYLSSDDTWSETGLSCANEASISGLPAAQADVAGLAGQWLSLDVTSAVKGNGDGNLTLVLHDDAVSDNYISLGSRESFNAPYLEVTYNSTCTPKTCAELGTTCGLVNDGCGNFIDCGGCTAPESCGGTGVPNVCACAPTSCSSQGKNCGTMPDGCGGTQDCGECDTGDTCTDNICVLNPPRTFACVPQDCDTQRKDCGTVSDGCGGTLDCGTCSSPRTCGGAGVANVCGVLGGGTKIAGITVYDTANASYWSTQADFEIGSTHPAIWGPVDWASDYFSAIDAGANNLLAKQWIQTKIASKNFNGTPGEAKVTLTMTGNVYLIVDDRATTNGTHGWTTEGWTDTGYNLTLYHSSTSSYPFSVWKKANQVGDVNLPIQNYNGAYNYVVVVE
jgi:hypothetical protein